MATHSKVTGGTAGHPSTRRKPYWVENTVDDGFFHDGFFHDDGFFIS